MFEQRGQTGKRVTSIARVSPAVASAAHLQDEADDSSGVVCQLLLSLARLYNAQGHVCSALGKFLTASRLSSASKRSARRSGGKVRNSFKTASIA